MSEPKHISEALGGAFVGPPGRDELVERERAESFVVAVASCYRTLRSRTKDPDRRAELTARVRTMDDVRRRVHLMPREECQEILRTYPDLLQRLRAEAGT